MKQVIYCADCGSKVDSEMGFCPKCDFEGDSGDVSIPPLADLWDMSMEQLGQLAESNSIRGWRRLEQKGLIYQLNQLRLVQAEESSIVSLQEEFLQLAQEKKVDEAKKKWAEIQESVDEIDEQLVLTMDWLLLPEQIAAALSEADIPELAFQIDDPEIHQLAHEMVQMFGYRTEVEQLLKGINAVSEIPAELLQHLDPVVNQLAQDKRAELKGAARAKAKGKLRARRLGQERERGAEDLQSMMSVDEFDHTLLEHEDTELRTFAQQRLNELERKAELLKIIKKAKKSKQIPKEALGHQDREVRKAAKLKRRKLLGGEKEDLLHRIRNSLVLDDIPTKAFGYKDSEVDTAARKRKEFLQRALATLDEIETIYSVGPLEELVEHEHAKVREAARLRLRILDEIPAKLRAKSSSPRMHRMVDELATEWAAEAAAAESYQAKVQGKADDVGFSLGDDVAVNYIGQSFSGVVQGFTTDGEFVEILNTETDTVWPIPFNCVTPL